MARLQKKSFHRPDEVRTLGRGRLELVDLGDVAVGRVTYPPGWRWSVDVQPLVQTARCEVHHIGFVVSGRLHTEMEDGSTLEVGPDDAFELPPGHDAWVVGDEPWIAVDSLGRRYFGVSDDEASRRKLGTILFTDIVGSTEIAARLGDAAWHALVAEMNSAARRELERFRGREVDTTGDGLLAVFEGPTRAVRCARALIQGAMTRGVHIRAGIHTGEYEPASDGIRGLAVHVAARVMGSAAADELRISAATASLLDPAEAVLQSLGPHDLKGVPAPVELYGVEPAPG
ncbi:MAG TPA: adenylate/guanylate cyclase domain-containing protein [Candidatus Limnocylindrales bacterium]|nr:adenylate/guanylate cyclase domain-containing protein [Candidatus Limnocylindrales bacterium]